MKMLLLMWMICYWKKWLNASFTSDKTFILSRRHCHLLCTIMVSLTSVLTYLLTYSVIWYRKLCWHHTVTGILLTTACLCCVCRLRISDLLFKLQKVLEFLVHWYVLSLISHCVCSLFQAVETVRMALLLISISVVVSQTPAYSATLCTGYPCSSL